MIELAAVVAGARSAGEKALPSVLRTLVGYENAQAKRLKRVEVGVAAVVSADYRTGLEYLRSAARSEPGTEEYRGFLSDGLRSLRRAVGAFEGTADHVRIASAAMLLACVYLVTGPRPESDAWADRTYRESVLAVRKAVNDANARMNATIGRLSFFSHAGFLVITSLFFLYGMTRLVFRGTLPIEVMGVSYGLLFVLYAEVRFYYRNVTAWLTRKDLRRWMQFLQENREVCSQIAVSRAKLPDYTLVRQDDSEGIPVGYRLVEVNRSPRAD